ncbi:carbohydrate ABC transporter permease [Propionibacteriaceae bacterium G57]|uniref:carbohydrate ABC transporter permease n=1 Tax=Aestuariimicrobium sp. G57 TaxID=3418485 RepID=UPI003DA794E2
MTKSLMSKTAWTIVWHAVLIVFSASMLVPLCWAAVTSFKSPGQIYSSSLLGDPPTLANYVHAWTVSGLPRQLVNTFVMALLIAGGQVVVAALASFGLAYFKPLYGRLVFAALAGSIVIPAQVLIIPQFLLTNALGWKNTMAGLVVPMLASCALQVLITYQHANGLPRSLTKAARLEGATSVDVFWHVVLPNIRPALNAVFILAFIGGWNEYLWPLLVTDDADSTTVQIGLQMFITAEGTNFGGLLAAAVISTLPILVIYLFASRQITDAFLKAGSA